MRIFSIYDTAAASYNKPFYAVSEGVALRIFQDILLDQDTSIGRHPEQFQLYDLGEFDEENGTFKTNPPVFVVGGNELVARYAQGVQRLEEALDRIEEQHERKMGKVRGFMDQQKPAVEHNKSVRPKRRK